MAWSTGSMKTGLVLRQRFSSKAIFSCIQFSLNYNKLVTGVPSFLGLDQCKMTAEEKERLFKNNH